MINKKREMSEEFKNYLLLGRVLQCDWDESFPVREVSGQMIIDRYEYNVDLEEPRWYTEEGEIYLRFGNSNFLYFQDQVV